MARIKVALLSARLVPAKKALRSKSVAPLLTCSINRWKLRRSRIIEKKRAHEIVANDKKKTTENCIELTRNGASEYVFGSDFSTQVRYISVKIILNSIHSLIQLNVLKKIYVDKYIVTKE